MIWSTRSCWRRCSTTPTRKGAFWSPCSEEYCHLLALGLLEGEDEVEAATWVSAAQRAVMVSAPV